MRAAQALVKQDAYKRKCAQTNYSQRSHQHHEAVLEDVLMKLTSVIAVEDIEHVRQDYSGLQHIYFENIKQKEAQTT